MGERRAAFIIGVSILVVVGIVLAWTFMPSANDEVAAAPLTEVAELSEIQQHVRLARLSIATSENYVGHRLRVVTATLKNFSDKPIRMAEVKMTFTDFDGNSIHEHVETVLNPRQRPLPPDGEYRFEVSFENLPRSWNYRVPIAEILKIAY
jgi:hypothetical protein